MSLTPPSKMNSLSQMKPKQAKQLTIPMSPVTTTPTKDEDDTDTPLGRTKHFGDNVTAHGFARISESRWLRRAIWTLLVLACFVAAFYFIIETLIRFVQHPTVTNIEIKYAPEVTFPAVTFCNMNPVMNRNFYVLTENDDELATITDSDKMMEDIRVGLMPIAEEPPFVPNSGVVGDIPAPGVPPVDEPISDAVIVGSAVNSGLGAAIEGTALSGIEAVEAVAGNVVDTLPSVDGTVADGAIAEIGGEAADAVPVVPTVVSVDSFVDAPAPVGAGSVDVTAVVESSNNVVAPSGPEASLDISGTLGGDPTSDLGVPSLGGGSSVGGDSSSSDLTGAFGGGSSGSSSNTENGIFGGIFGKKRRKKRSSEETSIYAEKSMEMSIMDAFMRSYFRQSDEMRRAMGHSLEDMLVYCSFAGQVCTHHNFTHFLHAQYGNCYTFNSAITMKRRDPNGERPKFVRSTRPGPYYGLSLVLNIERDEYVDMIAPSYGVIVSLHDPLTMSFPESDGYAVSAGFSTTIATKTVNITRQGSPYGDCFESESQTDATVDEYNERLMNVSLYAESRNADYSFQACINTCFSKELLRECSCTLPELKAKETQTLCFSDQEKECVKRARRRHAAGQINCDECTQPCEEIEYVNDVSSATWPTVKMGEVYKTMLETKHGKEKVANVTVGENLVKVSIYFKQLNVETIQQEPAIVPTDLIGSLGGQLGLYIGFSILTIFEFLEYGLDMLRIVLCRRR